jgi:hypothetical protein
MKLKWNEKNTGIYQIRNTINHKVYIGKASNLYRRKYQHFGELKSGKHKNKYLQSSFNKYGDDNFVFEVIEFCNLDELGKREYYWINYYNSYKRDIGYNIELLDENGVTIRSYESINQMRLTLKKNKGKYIKLKGKDNPTSKEVHQYSLTGDYINSFGSCHEAAESLGCKERFTVISKCARKENGSSFGFQWRYYKTDFIEKYDIVGKMDELRKQNNIKLSKLIIAINLETMEETEFSCINLAAKTYNIAISCIARIVKGERKMSKKLNMTFHLK